MSRRVQVTRDATERNRWVAVAWAMLGNLILLAGVLLWGWPAGNLFLLFWIENALLGVITVIKLSTLKERANGGKVAFFAVHYGLFCVVHLVFIGVLAFMSGVSLTLLAFGLPVVLITISLLADLTTNWFLGGLRFRASEGQVFGSPYPRVAVLHVATLLGFGLTLSLHSQRRTGELIGILDSMRGWLAQWGIDLTATGAVGLVLVAVKIIGDLLVSGITFSVKSAD